MNVALVRYHDTGDVNTRLPASLNRVRGVLPPLGLAYIAAALEEAAHRVCIIDAQAEGYTGADVHRVLLEFKADIVGVTTMTSNFKGALEVARIAKSCDMTTVMGGPNVEVFPAETLAYQEIDYGIIGEGETACVQLLHALEKAQPLHTVTGLVFRSNGAININAPAFIEDINELPLPARHLLPLNRYTSLISTDPMTTMITSRGCPHQCSFCFKQTADKKMRFRDPRSVVDEMELLSKDYSIREIMFYDDTIMTSRAHIAGICNEIIKRGFTIRWESPSRLDRVDMDLLQLMKRAGCVRLRYGVESGDEDILKAMHKHINRDQIVKAFQLTRAVGIQTFAYFMTGYLHETRRAFEHTMALIKEIKPDQIMMTITVPYPKTRLEKEAEAAGKIPPGYWRDFTLGAVNTPMPLLVDEAQGWIRAAYQRFYLDPGYIVRRMRSINSLNQLRKHVCAALAVLLFKLR